MIESKTGDRLMISAEREQLFKDAERKLHFSAQVYALGERFEGLSPDLARIVMLDVTQVPGCHYGLRNVFVPILYHLETHGISVEHEPYSVSPETAIIVETSTGNGWVAAYDGAHALGYEFTAVMPDGLPEHRYKHPLGITVPIIKTPKEDYAEGMRLRLQHYIKENPQRKADGKKIYVSPDHSVRAADITVRAMSELGIQLCENVGMSKPLTVVVSMGNGASLCALGEYVKQQISGSRVIATESFAFGGGYDEFALKKGLHRYRGLYGIDPANPNLMKTFSLYGTNHIMSIKLPLQEEAMKGDLIDNYMLIMDQSAMSVYERLTPSSHYLEMAKLLPNLSQLPKSLYDTYGNSTLANIAAASQFTNQGEIVVAMAYDGRGNYR